MTVIRAYLLWAAIAIPVGVLVYAILPGTLRRGRTARRWGAVSVWPSFLGYSAGSLGQWAWAGVFVVLAGSCGAAALLGPAPRARRHAAVRVPSRWRRPDRIDWWANND